MELKELDLARHDSTLKAKRLCAEWLASCVQIGWPKESLSDLEMIWWRYHDGYGRLKARAAQAEGG